MVRMHTICFTTIFYFNHLENDLTKALTLKKNTKNKHILKSIYLIPFRTINLIN